MAVARSRQLLVIADTYEADEARFLSEISQLKQRLSSSEDKFAAAEVQHQKILSEAEEKFAAAEV